jgi:hypothetical protein
MPVRLEKIKIRRIEKKDNAAVAKLIRSTLKEFGANYPGTVEKFGLNTSIMQSVTLDILAAQCVG